jgi:hypothetical protein
MDYRLLAKATWDVLKIILGIAGIIVTVGLMAVYLSTTMFFIIMFCLLAIYWIVSSIQLRYRHLVARKNRSF